MPKYTLTYNNSVHVFDSDAYLLDGKRLQGQEYAILNRLVEKRGNYVSKDELARLLWDIDSIGEEYNLKPRISQLRRKFGNDSEIIKCEKFKFVDQAGYHLDCDIYETETSKASIFTPYKNASISEIDKETEYRIRKVEYKGFEDKYLNDNKNLKVAIFSHGGIGKTTFARILYNRLQHKYTSVGWIDYSKNIDESILASTDKWQNEPRDIRLEKINEFFSNDERKLLIIDNVIDNPTINQYPINETDGYFNFDKLLKYSNLDLIITTRFEHFPGYNMYPLKELDEVSGFELFVYNYDSLDNIESYNYNDYRLINDIVDIAHYNPLLIELFARAAKYHYFDSLMDLYEFIKTDRYKEASVVEKVRSLYKIDTLSEQQQQILWEFAILPNMSLNGSDIEAFLGIKPNNADFRYLVDRGWISFKGKDGCSMHDVIKESILTRSRPNTYQEQTLQENSIDLTLSANHKSFCYKHNSSGFAPDNCYINIHSKQTSLDGLFNSNNTFSDIKKRVALLSAIANHVLLSNEKIGYIYYLIGTNTYHKIGDKENSEEPLRMAMECLKELVDYQSPIIKEEQYSYNIDILYIIVSYELAYALSSMGYNRLQESYELMEATLNTHSASSSHRFDYEIRKLIDAPQVVFDIYRNIGTDLFKSIHYSFPEQSIVNYFIDISEKALNERYVLGSISDYNLLARIMDHAAYIISIYNPADYSTAEKYLIASLNIRIVIHKIHSLKRMRKDEFSEFIKPYADFFDSIYKTYNLSNSELNDVFGNSYNEMHFTSIYDNDEIKEYRNSVQNYFSNFEQENAQNQSYLNSNYVYPETSIDTNGIIRYYLLHDDFKDWLTHVKDNKNHNIDEKDIIIKYFSCYSDSNYISSLQDLATTEDNLGYLYIQMNRCLDAEPLLLSALNRRIELEDREPKKHLSELSWTYNNVGEMYLRLYESEKKDGYLDDAITNYSNAADLRLELNEIYKDRYLDNLAWSYMGLWRCYVNKDDSTTAEEYRKKALKIYEDLNGDKKYDDDIKILNSRDPLSKPLNWVGNQSHFKPAKAVKNKKRN